MLQGIYAQSFICVSMNASTTNLVGISLLKMRPKYYSQSLPGAQLPLFPDIDIALRSTGTIHSLPYAISVRLRRLPSERLRRMSSRASVQSTCWTPSERSSF